MGLISRILDSVDKLGVAAADTTVAAGEAKVDLIVKLSAVLLGALVVLILFAIDSTLTIALIGILIVGMWLLDVDIGGGSSNDGPRQ